MRLRVIGLYVLVFVLVVGATYLYGTRRNLLARYLQHEQRERQTEAARAKCTELEKKIEVSREQVDHLGNDPVKLEDVIRRTEKKVRPGEKIYRIEPAPEKE